MIIGIKDNDRIVLGWSDWSDSSIFDNDKVLDDNLPFRIIKDKGIIIGCGKTKYDADIILSNETVMNECNKEELTYEGVINNIAPLLGGSVRWENSLSIAQGDKLFDISPTEYALDVTDYVVHGYYTDYAKSRLMCNMHKTAEDRIIDAFQFRGKMVGERVLPIVIVDTKTLQTKIITE